LPARRSARYTQGDQFTRQPFVREPFAMNPGRPSLLLLAIVLSAGSVSPGQHQSAADELTLHNGGNIRGQVAQDGSSREQVVLRTPDGITLKLARSQVANTIRQSEIEVEYQQRAPLVADNVDEQWKFAEWCRKNRLPKQRRIHLQRLIELDLDHVQARHALGYSFVNGQWRLPDRWQQEEGYMRHRGRWRTAQEIELIEAREQQERAQRNWLARIKRLRKSLNSANASEAWAEILAIRDPQAVYALRENLEKEQFRPVKLLYVKALGQTGGADAFKALIETSLNDRDEEIFHACADEIIDRKPPFAVTAYIKGLKDANNVRVNRSAYVLSQLDAQEAIVPLIESLVTVHKLVSQPRGGQSPDSMSTTFTSPTNASAEAIMPAGGTSFTAGKQAKVIPIAVQNQAVLAALVQLSDGASFGFNKQAWTNWHDANRSRLITVAGRRSE
jgi:hypothetical protein